MSQPFPGPFLTGSRLASLCCSPTRTALRAFSCVCADAEYTCADVLKGVCGVRRDYCSEHRETNPLSLAPTTRASPHSAPTAARLRPACPPPVGGELVRPLLDFVGERWPRRPCISSLPRASVLSSPPDTLSHPSRPGSRTCSSRKPPQCAVRSPLHLCAQTPLFQCTVQREGLPLLPTWGDLWGGGHFS